MVAQRRRKPIVLRPGEDPASLSLKHPPRELFAQAVARGVNVDVAYREAGYEGRTASRRELRCSADVDARIRWLLAKRMESDFRARARTIEKEADARLRTIRELEAIALGDVRDVVQWDVEPTFSKAGDVTGERVVMKVTPSRLLTKHQAAMVKSISKKGDLVKFEMNSKLEALGHLAKILGLVQPDAPGPTNITNNTQVNVVGTKDELAIEAARRLAFAIEKAVRATQGEPKMVDVTPAPPKEGE